MIVVTSRIRVTSGNADDLAGLYARRLRLADGSPGCLGVEVLRHVDRPDEFVVTSRWRDRPSYDIYRRSPEFRAAHGRLRELPGVLKIDLVDRAVDVFEVLS